MKDIIQRGLGHIDEDNARRLELLNIVIESAYDRPETCAKTQAGYTYVSDNRVVIRVPKIPDATLSTSPDFSQLPWSVFSEGNTFFMPLPSLKKPMQEKCMNCNDATGAVKCDCMHCKGHACEDCNGTGLITVTVRIKIGRNDVSDRFLRVVAMLPNPLIAESKYMHALPFKFTGGEGFVMPMRRDNSSC